MGVVSSLSSLINPSIRDQAINRGLFAFVSPSDRTDPLFAKYDIRFNEIKANEKVFAGPEVDSTPFTNNDFNLTVCEISYSARCRLLPVLGEHNEDKYDLVDASYKEPRKLIRVQIHKERDNTYSLKYQIFQQPEQIRMY